ncbi:MAG TPA: 50S ribosomal protein L20 [Anaerolineaceae bacterium]|jgi:large subunit ribosomal protein L20|nr:50S ribosomal protein L20 [Anaerolineaceae bacterium]
MARVKSGPYRRRRHQRRIAYNSGYTGTRNHLFRRANEAFLKSQWYAYNDRRNRKRDLRKLWIVRINAAARQNGITYSRLISAMRNSDIILNRKVLADLAVRDPKAFAEVVNKATSKP